MLDLHPITLGILLGTTALIVLGITYALLRSAPKSFTSSPIAGSFNLGTDTAISKNEDAFLIVQPGGKIAHGNKLLYEWFNLSESESLNLEYLARRVHPMELFLRLCAQEGNGRFSIKGLLVEASSFSIPYFDGQAMFVGLHRPDLTALSDKEKEIPTSSLDIITGISQSMTASLDLESTIQSILESIEFFIHADISQITIWDPLQNLLLPYTFSGVPGVDRSLVKNSYSYKSGEGFSGYLQSQLTPLLISDVDIFQNARPIIDRRKIPLRSYLGIPLIIAGEFIGTIELGSFHQGSFSGNDLEVMNILAGQAGIALKNALVHQEEERRLVELTGLANLAEAISTLHEPRDFFRKLILSIQTLFDASYLGFLLFDETQNSLVIQVPFIGIQDQFIDLAKIPIEPLSPAEELTLSFEPIISEDASQDARLESLGVGHIAQAVGIKNTALIPLLLRNRSLGYLQIADKKDGTTINKDDIRLLSIVAGQVAPIIDNARLVQVSRKRALQAESIRRIASLVSSAVTQDEITSLSLKEVQGLLRADIVYLSLLNGNQSTLEIPKSSISCIENFPSVELPPIAATDPEFLQTSTSTQKVYASGISTFLDNIPSVYVPTLELLSLRSAIIVPVIIRDQPIGEMLVGSRSENHFQRDDIELTYTAAGQLAGAIERSFLYSQTDENLRRQVDELGNIFRTSQELYALTDIETILNRIYSEIKRSTMADGVRILLFDKGYEISKQAVSNPKIAGSFGNIEKGDLTPLEHACLVNGYPQRSDRENLEIENNKSAYSLATPLVYSGKALGVISLYFDEGNDFDEVSLSTVEALSDSAAIAIDNAYRHEMSHEKILTLQDKSQQTKRLESGLNIIESVHRQVEFESIYNILAQQISLQLGFDTVLVAKRADRGPELLTHYGWSPSGLNLEMLLGQRNPINICLDVGKIIITYDIQRSRQEFDWSTSPLLSQLLTHSFICVPIFVDTTFTDSSITPPIDIVILAITQSAASGFTLHDKELFLEIARHTSLALENLARLDATSNRLREIGFMLDFTRKLDPLNPTEIMASILETIKRVIPHAQAGLVMLWDDGQGKLIPQVSDGYQDNNEMLLLGFHPDEALPGRAFTSEMALISEDLNFALDYNLTGENLVKYQRGTAGMLPTSCLVVPLKVGETMLGVLELDNFDRTSAFTRDDKTLVLTLVQQTALILENARLFQAVEGRVAQLKALTEVATAITSSLQVEKIIAPLLDQLATFLPYDTGTFWLRQGGSLIISAVRGFNDGEKRLGLESEVKDSPLLLEIIETGKPINIPNTILDTRLQHKNESNYLSWFAVPVISKNEVIGIISLEKSQANYYKEEHIEAALIFSSQVAAAIENARLLEQLQVSLTKTERLSEDLEARVVERTKQLEEEHQRTETLLEIITELSASLDMDIILNRTLNLVNRIVDAGQSTIMLAEGTGSALLHRASLGYTTPPPKGGQPTKLNQGEGLAGWVISNQEAVLIANLREDSRWVTIGDRETEHRSAIVVPLTIGEEALGALLVFHKDPDHFSIDQLDLVNATAKQIAVALNNAQLFNLIRDQAENLGTMLRSQQVESSRLRSILEAVADGVLVTDSSGKITIFNPSVEKILGLESSKIIGKPLENFIGLFGKASHSWTTTIRFWSENPSTHISGDFFSEQITLENESIVEVNLAPVIYKNEFLGTVSIFRDITHQVEVDRLKSEFVATVSHELRTPMTSIKGYVDILLMGAAGNLSESQSEFLNIVKSNTDRLNFLVNDLLDISQVEAGRAMLSKQAVDIESIINEVVEFAEERYSEEQKPFNFEVQVDQKTPQVYGDPERIRQVVENLVQNSYKFTPSGGRLHIHVHTRDHFVQVDFQDNGIGIPPEDHQRIFERFYRIENPLVISSSGAGLGLPIVKNIIQMHGGDIWVMSTGVPGKGSTFSFTLPMFISDANPSREVEKQSYEL